MDSYQLAFTNTTFSIYIHISSCSRVALYQILTAMASKIRQNYREETEALINKQINMEIYTLGQTSWINSPAGQLELLFNWIGPVCMPATSTCPCLSTLPEGTRDDQATHGFEPSSRSLLMRIGSMGRRWSSTRTREEAKLSSKTLPSPPPWTWLLSHWSWNWKILRSFFVHFI